MWQTDWAPEPDRNRKPLDPHASMVARDEVRSVYSLLWMEHCVECAVPDCYTMCPLYVARQDRKCARFKNGITPNWQYPGLFDYGGDVEFRRWGKLEANFHVGGLSTGQVRFVDRMDRLFLRSIRPFSFVLRDWSPKLRLNGVYTELRNNALKALRVRKQNYDEFVMEAWNLQDQAVRLVVECWQQEPKFRTVVLLEPGRSVYRIPAASMNVDLYGTFGMVRVFPENDVEAHLVFSWLDFVQYRSVARIDVTDKSSPVAGQTSVSKVKCVIWDLDNTVWDGILGEQDVDKISLRADVMRTMLALDERGVLQSVASKNDHASTWQVLERLGVAHLFLYPQINWSPKSANIRRIAELLNIGMDSCVFIDDSAFERAEVQHELSGVRAFSDGDVPRLLERPEFKAPVTAESRQRRSYYTAESQRKERSLEFGDRYEAFLRTCNMEATLFVPKEREHAERCLELLQRSNQLNLSTHRYSAEEFGRLLSQPEALCICTACHDRFGEYGIVGFASLLVSKDKLVLKDFVLSCRVAQKKLENGWFAYLASLAKSAGYGAVTAAYAKTSRNSVLLKALLEVGFVQKDIQENASLLELDCNTAPPASDIVSIVSDSIDLRSRLLSSIAS